MTKWTGTALDTDSLSHWQTRRGDNVQKNDYSIRKRVSNAIEQNTQNMLFYLIFL